MSKGVKGVLILVGALLLVGLIITIISFISAQGEKSRDNDRIADMNSLQVSLAQTYNDIGSYPSSLSDKSLASYLDKTFKDPKDGETINGCTFGYTYEVFDKGDLMDQGYRLSTCLESKSNKKKLTGDWGVYDNKYEIGKF